MQRSKQIPQRSHSPDYNPQEIQYGRGQSFSDGPLRQMPHSLERTVPASFSGKLHESPDIYIPSDRLPQYEHTSLVKVVTRLRDADHFSPHSSTTPHAQAEAASTFSQNVIEQLYETIPQDWLPAHSSSRGHIRYIEHEDPLVVSTRELARAVAHRAEGNEILETSRRQLEEDMFESKRLLQEQMQVSMKVHPKAQSTQAGEQAHESLGGVEGDVTLVKQLNLLEAELKTAQSALYADQDTVIKCNEELTAQTKIAKQESDQRKLLELQIEELKQQHIGEMRENLDTIEALNHQLESAKASTEQQQQIHAKELIFEREQSIELSTQITILQEQLENEKKSSICIMQQLQGQINAILDEKAKLEERCATYEEYKKKVEEHRRQYERAGTDILKLLNEANQKVIALEEHKWELEDQAAERRILYENERRLFAQCRHQLEHEIVKLNQQFADQMQQQKTKYEAEMTQQQHLFQETLTEKDKTFTEDKSWLNRALDRFRSELEDLRAQVVVLSNELSLAKKSHLDGQQQWNEEKHKWEEEKALLCNANSELEANLHISKTKSDNLQIELEDNCHKLEALKCFFVEKLA